MLSIRHDFSQNNPHRVRHLKEYLLLLKNLLDNGASPKNIYDELMINYDNNSGNPQKIGHLIIGSRDYYSINYLLVNELVSLFNQLQKLDDSLNHTLLLLSNGFVNKGILINLENSLKAGSSPHKIFNLLNIKMGHKAWTTIMATARLGTEEDLIVYFNFLRTLIKNGVSPQKIFDLLTWCVELNYEQKEGSKTIKIYIEKNYNEYKTVACPVYSYENGEEIPTDDNHNYLKYGLWICVNDLLDNRFFRSKMEYNLLLKELIIQGLRFFPPVPHHDFKKLGWVKKVESLLGLQNQIRNLNILNNKHGYDLNNSQKQALCHQSLHMLFLQAASAFQLPLEVFHLIIGFQFHLAETEVGDLYDKMLVHYCKPFILNDLNKDCLTLSQNVFFNEDYTRAKNLVSFIAGITVMDKTKLAERLKDEKDKKEKLIKEKLQTEFKQNENTNPTLSRILSIFKPKPEPKGYDDITSKKLKEDKYYQIINKYYKKFNV